MSRPTERTEQVKDMVAGDRGGALPRAWEPWVVFEQEGHMLSDTFSRTCGAGQSIGWAGDRSGKAPGAPRESALRPDVLESEGRKSRQAFSSWKRAGRAEETAGAEAVTGTS